MSRQAERLNTLLRAKRVGEEFMIFFGNRILSDYDNGKEIIQEIKEELEDLQARIDGICGENLVI